MPQKKYWYELDNAGVRPRSDDDDRSEALAGSMAEGTVTRDTLKKKFKSRRQRMDEASGF